MPELPDITVYIEALERRVVGHTLERIRFRSPFLLRTVEPPIGVVDGREVRGLRRLGKRIAFDVGDELFLVLHLMIAGRLKWQDEPKPLKGKLPLAAFDFSSGSLVLTEASKKKRASLHLVRGHKALSAFDRGGIQVFESDLEEFAAALRCENHTVKRSLTDPRLFSGIGNAYSDEILHAAKLSPIRLTSKLTDEEIERLYHATRSTLELWIDRLREQTGDGFPTKVTAFRDGMAVHGRFREPCPVCGAPVQRIVYADRETNYCAACQTGGKRLADRALSRLLGKDWPRSLEDLEEK